MIFNYINKKIELISINSIILLFTLYIICQPQNVSEEI